MAGVHRSCGWFSEYLHFMEDELSSFRETERLLSHVLSLCTFVSYAGNYLGENVHSMLVLRTMNRVSLTKHANATQDNKHHAIYLSRISYFPHSGLSATRSAISTLQENASCDNRRFVHSSAVIQIHTRLSSRFACCVQTRESVCPKYGLKGHGN